MKSNAVLWLVVLGLILIGGYSWMNRSAMNPTPTPTPALTQNEEPTALAVVELAEQNGLGQSGTASFTENAAGNLVVALALSGGTFTAPQPAHIHVGVCPNPGAVEYPLADVVDGQSETILDTTWAAVMASGKKLALNIHKSSAESKVYTACGNLPATEADTTMTGEGVKLDTKMSIDY